MGLFCNFKAPAFGRSNRPFNGDKLGCSLLMQPRRRLLVAGIPLAATFLVLLHAQEPKTDFARDIQPLFAKSCYGCHGAANQSAGLRLDSRDAVIGKVVKPGDSANSELYKRVAGLSSPQMPMGGKLAPADIAKIKAWIDAGDRK